MRILLDIPYPRPKQLSDPHNDFGGPAGTAKYLAVPDEEMTWKQFNRMFQKFLPAGTYEELVYFVPAVLNDFVREAESDVDHENGVNEYWEGFFAFLRNNMDRLHADRLIEPLRNAFQQCLDILLQTFTVEHIPASERWRPHYHVRHEDTFQGLMISLAEFEVFREVAVSTLNVLAGQKDDPVKSAWFLLYTADADEDSIEDPAFGPLVTGKDLICYHIEKVRQSLAKTQPSPYWEKMFNYLGTEEYLRRKGEGKSFHLG